MENNLSKSKRARDEEGQIQEDSFKGNTNSISTVNKRYKNDEVMRFGGSENIPRRIERSYGKQNSDMYNNNGAVKFIGEYDRQYYRDDEWYSHADMDGSGWNSGHRNYGDAYRDESGSNRFGWYDSRSRDDDSWYFSGATPYSERYDGYYNSDRSVNRRDSYNRGSGYDGYYSTYGGHDVTALGYNDHDSRLPYDSAPYGSFQHNSSVASAVPAQQYFNRGDNRPWKAVQRGSTVAGDGTVAASPRFAHAQPRQYSFGAKRVNKAVLSPGLTKPASAVLKKTKPVVDNQSADSLVAEKLAAEELRLAEEEEARRPVVVTDASVRQTAQLCMSMIDSQFSALLIRLNLSARKCGLRSHADILGLNSSLTGPVELTADALKSLGRIDLLQADKPTATVAAHPPALELRRQQSQQSSATVVSVDSSQKPQQKPSTPRPLPPLSVPAPSEPPVKTPADIPSSSSSHCQSSFATGPVPSGSATARPPPHHALSSSKSFHSHHSSGHFFHGTPRGPPQRRSVDGGLSALEQINRLASLDQTEAAQDSAANTFANSEKTPAKRSGTVPSSTPVSGTALPTSEGRGPSSSVKRSYSNPASYSGPQLDKTPQMYRSDDSRWSAHEQQQQQQHFSPASYSNAYPPQYSAGRGRSRSRSPGGARGAQQYLGTNETSGGDRYYSGSGGGGYAAEYHGGGYGRSGGGVGGGVDFGNSSRDFRSAGSYRDEYAAYPSSQHSYDSGRGGYGAPSGRGGHAQRGFDPFAFRSPR